MYRMKKDFTFYFFVFLAIVTVCLVMYVAVRRLKIVEAFTNTEENEAFKTQKHEELNKMMENVIKNKDSSKETKDKVSAVIKELLDKGLGLPENFKPAEESKQK